MKTLHLLSLACSITILLGCENYNLGAQSTTDTAKVLTAKASISKELKANDHLSIDERVQLYLKLKTERPNDFNFENEDELTMYGYGLLWDNNPKDATEIFKLIVSQFPNSSNPYDSLAEGYLTLGNKDLALENYKKSLQMNPENFNAEDAIERIKFPNKKWLTPAEKFSQKFTVEQYREDLEELVKKLLTVHPNALKFTSEENLRSLVASKKQAITQNTTYAEFSWHCSEIIAAINCSHTSNGGFQDEWNMLPPKKRFPLEVYWVRNELFVINNTGNAENVEIKDQILSINGVDVAKILADIYRHIPSQGNIETSKRYKFNYWATGMIPYALHFPETYSLELKEKNTAVVLNSLKGGELSFEVPFKSSCPDGLCLDFIEETNTAILTVATFNYYPWNNLDYFIKFMDDSFKEITNKKIEHIIVDLRGNGGGSSDSSVYLLRYLMNKPFVYFLDSENQDNEILNTPFPNNFKGKTSFIIDGVGNSTTGHFMAMVREYNLGPSIGEELGSNQFCTAGQLVVRLPTTKMVYYVANVTSQVKVKNLDVARGIVPDYKITQPITDYIDNVDTLKKFALSLIANDKK